MPDLPVHHQLLEFTQTHVHWVGDAIQPSHPLLSPSPPSPNPSQQQSLFQWVNSSHEVAKVLEFQLQHQSFQWTPRTDLLQNRLVGSPCSHWQLRITRIPIGEGVNKECHEIPEGWWAPSKDVGRGTITGRVSFLVAHLMVVANCYLQSFDQHHF